MIQLLVMYMVAALGVPIVMRFLGRNGFIVASLFPLIGFIWTIAQGPAVLAGDYPVQDVDWVPGLDLSFTFRLDTLSWIMALLVNGVGVLVLLYSARYFSRKASGLARFAGFFLAFAGSMFGLVTTDNTLMMYTMWELTTVFSFLLIGHNRSRQSSRRAAMEAIIVTTFGGLAMLGGIIILGELPGGSYSFTELIEAGQNGTLFTNSEGVTSSLSQGLLTGAIVLVLLGALSKSAIFPFHFWLPAAMAAPTPTSAYLHAAAMVKAGIYLVARLGPGFADLAVWQWLILPTGLATMIIGGYRALRQHDTKLILAFGTVSQLGFIMAMVGHGRSDVVLAGLALLVAHALFKACLFLCVGIVDWATGTRDLRELSGIGKRKPLLAVVAGIAVASMAGLPPLPGFVAKEAVLHGLTHGSGYDMAMAWVVVLGSILTLAYGLRFWWGCFWSKPGVEDTEIKNKSRMILVSPTILAVLIVILGFLPSWWESLLAPHANLYPGEAGHLALWAGFGLPVIMTIIVIALGLALFAIRRPFESFQSKVAFPGTAEGTYRRIVVIVENLSADVTSRTQSGSQPTYLSIAVGTMILGGGAALLFGGTDVSELNYRLWDSPAQVPVVGVIAIAALLAARARRRLKAVLLTGVVGYGMALIYELQGAPDLALTQVLVETMTLIVFVLVLRRLPAYFSDRPMKASRWFRITMGAVAGLMVGGFAFFAANARQQVPVSSTFADEAYQFGYGRNIVNVTLVDIRAWDTMGEISVVLACAIGVASLLFVRDRHGRIDSLRNLPRLDRQNSVWRRGGDAQVAAPRHTETVDQHVREPGRNLSWLPGSKTLAESSRSLVFEVGTRLIYHTLIIGSLFFLFSGHNQPGGGFAGGLTAGLALAVRYLAGGRYELGAALPLHPGYIMGTGLFTATVSALFPIFLGGATLQTAVFDFELPGFGPVHLATAIFFDIGVYLVVVGMALDLLRSLGAEVDRHGEEEGMDHEGTRVPAPQEDRRLTTADSESSKEGAR